MAETAYSIHDNLHRLMSGSMELSTPVDTSTIQFIASKWHAKYEVEGVVGSDLLITVNDVLYKAQAGATAQYQITKVGEYCNVEINVPSKGFKQTLPRVLIGASTQEFMKSMVWLAGWLSGEAWDSESLTPDTLPESWKLSIGKLGTTVWDIYEVETKDKGPSDNLDQYQFLQVASGIKKMEVYKLSTKIERVKINDSL